MEYLAYRTDTDRNYLIGAFSGAAEDIIAYCDHNHPSYGTELEPLNVKTIPPGYKNKLHTLKTNKAALESQIKNLDQLMKETL